MKQFTRNFLSASGILFLSLAVPVTTASAQSPTCQLQGKIVDDQNKPLPFAAIILSRVGAVGARGTSANDEGVFRFDSLHAGKYSLTVRRFGFAPQSRNLEILTGEPTSVSFTMVPTEEQEAPVYQPQRPGRIDLSAQPLRWYSFEEGTALARQSNKKLLIDVYTDWCSWCKKMDKEVYTNREVKNAVQSYFVPVKVNAESSREFTYDGPRLSEMGVARAMGVDGYPTTVFLTSNAEPIAKVAGYLDSQELLKVLRSVGQDRQ
jgi:thioredoxin-related protein